METESRFLYTKNIYCPVCGKIFGSKVVRSARLRRLQPEFDLRPRFADVDTLKYDVYACPHCGYAAISRSFEVLSKGQIMLLKENICANFKPKEPIDLDEYDYRTAISRYEQALMCSKAKRAKTSEIAYTCLKLSWMYRSMRELMTENTKEEITQKEEAGKIQETYYRQAYDGFQKALATEDFPICGMDMHTMDYLLACLACYFKEYAFASKSVSNILGSQTADRRIKDKALDLKQEIIANLRKPSGS